MAESGFRQDCCEAAWRGNPVLLRLLGLCPLLAVSDRVVTGIAIGVLFALTMLWIQTLVGAVRSLIPVSVRLPFQAVVAACGVTVLQLVVQAHLPALAAALGVYLPVLAGCCLIVARTTESAWRRPAALALRDGVVHGLAALAFVLIFSAVRELLGYGTLLRDLTLLVPGTTWNGYGVLPEGWRLPIAAMPAGAMLLLGAFLALRNHVAAGRGRPVPQA
jgi:electron transport complex protein RnfE